MTGLSPRPRSAQIPVLLRQLHRRRIGPRELWYEHLHHHHELLLAASVTPGGQPRRSEVVYDRLGLAAGDDDHRRLLAVAHYLAR